MKNKPVKKKSKTSNEANGNRASREDAPRRQKKAVGHDKRIAALTGRVNVIPSNGDAPTAMEIAPEPVTMNIGEAMRKAVEELGETIIDDQLAPSQMRQLGECYEEVTKRQAAFNAKNDEAKTAKKSLEIATDMLLARVKEFTHPTPLPLFDATEAESDRESMLETIREMNHDDPPPADAATA